MASLKRKTRREEMQSLRTSLKAQYVKNVGGSPYQKDTSHKGNKQETYERLATPRSKVHIKVS